MAPAIFGLRLWMAFVTLFNLSIIIAWCAYLIPLNNKYADIAAKADHDTYNDFNPIQRYEYYWGDYAIIIASVVLFPAYLYSIWGKKPLVSNKYTRAFLMLLPALFLIGVQLRQVDVTLMFIKFVVDRPRKSGFNPFSCANSDGSVNADCALIQSHIFVPIVTGFFTIIEVAVTLFRGPLHSAKEIYH
ncbi:hypothetical protein EC957_010117 [Mortierella hygrophila]|uniref:Uncharacterized protein n=1 Tax=Mortierella hygrophila TaxID=979708 RepID=A0A9P6FB76_9FUNG|nr:hypothetical protein EC957_010117 [Mortierella hygrophila]